MFRKPRSPLSRTRFKHGAAALKQADKSTSHATPVEQALAIIEGLWRVLLAILVSPGSLDRKINGDTQVQKTTPKYTFLVLSTFVAIKATKMSLTILMLAMLPFVRGCEPETQQKMVFPSIEAELILPKLEDILLMGVPSVLLVILFLRVYARILKFITAKRTASRFYNVACYIAGWQYLASSVIIICTLRLFADTESGIGYTLEALRWGGIGALAWGTLLYTWTLLSIEKLPPWRRYLKRTAKFGLILASSAVLSALVLVAGLATAVPLAIHGSKKELIKPLLQVTLIKTERDEDMNQTLRFVLRNLSENTVYLSGGSVHFLYDPTQQASDKISSCETLAPPACYWNQIKTTSLRSWWHRSPQPHHNTAPSATGPTIPKTSRNLFFICYPRSIFNIRPLNIMRDVSDSTHWFCLKKISFWRLSSSILRDKAQPRLPLI
jgi:hypothetical protein